jgi:hypothetical protein
MHGARHGSLRRSRFAATAVAVAIACAGLPATALHAQSPAPASPPASPPAPPPGGPTGAQSASDWPQVLTANGVTFRVFDPLFNSMAGDEVGFQVGIQRLRDGAAPATAQPGGPVNFGLATLLAQATPGANAGDLEVTGFTVQSLVFADGPGTAVEMAALQAAIAGKSIGIPRAALLRDMQLQNARAAGEDDLGDDVPAIRVIDRPAVLVQFDGAPMFRDLATTGWRIARNTPFLLLQSPDGGFNVQVGARWGYCMDLDGEFVLHDAPPPGVLAALGPVPKAPGVVASRAVERAAAAAPVPVPVPVPARFPKVIVAPDPTVLVWTDGEPQLQAVAPGIATATNASSLLLRMDDGNTWWTIASGRWFRAPALDGSWSLVRPADVPATLMLLPADRRHAHARASVPGTREATAAVAAAQERRTVTLGRSSAKCSMTYAGNPVFAGIDGTLLRWAVNASQPTIECDRRYYCCDNAAWFVADDPQGPWSPCEDVPDAIYTIPASSPVFAATFVEVVGSGPDTVSFGYTPGYFGTYVSDGTVVHGSGYATQPLLYGESDYSPLPQTYGRTMAFDADTGTFAPPSDVPPDAPAPAVQPAVLVDGWVGWGWCPGWTTAWAWGWDHPEWWGNWGPWWNQFNPYWNHWWDAQHVWKQEELQAEADRQAAADEAAARQQASEDAALAQRQAAEEAAEQARIQARDRLAAEQDRARAEEARFRDMRTYDQLARDRAQAAVQARLQGPTAKPGTWDWWYQYYNDLSNGYLSQATGFRDPRWPVQR